MVSYWTSKGGGCDHHVLCWYILAKKIIQMSCKSTNLSMLLLAASHIKMVQMQLYNVIQDSLKTNIILIHTKKYYSSVLTYNLFHIIVQSLHHHYISKYILFLFTIQMSIVYKSYYTCIILKYFSNTFLPCNHTMYLWGG